MKSHLRALVMICLAASCLAAAESHGKVIYGGLALPGATVTAVMGDKKVGAASNDQGLYLFPELAEGTWTMTVEMLCFAPQKQDIKVGADGTAPEWDMKLLPIEAMNSQIQAPVSIVAAASTANGAKPGTAAARPGFQSTKLNENANASATTAAAPPPPPPPDTGNQNGGDALMVAGTVNNGAASPFAQAQSFGNARKGSRSRFQRSIYFTLANSALDARSWSQTGQNTAKPSTNRLTAQIQLGGPVILPRLHLVNQIQFQLNYSFTRDRNGTSQAGLLPDAFLRAGDFSNALNALTKQPVTVVDPTTGIPFAGNVIPESRISPQAIALLKLYPQPNFTSNQYNYQIPIVRRTSSDNFTGNLNKTLNRKNQLSGGIRWSRSDNVNPNLLGFVDSNDGNAVSLNVSLNHQFTNRIRGTFTYTFAKNSNRANPFFAGVRNVSGEAGILGNNQDPINWGPPSLSFSSGISGLSDGNASSNRTLSHSFGYTSSWSRRSHGFSWAVNLRRNQNNLLSQSNPRGRFTFNGLATGADFADFLLGVPATTSLAFGNADKYFRSSYYQGYLEDDWRVNPVLTLKVRLTYVYNTPVSEKYGRLVNLAVSPGFDAVTQVIANTSANSPAALVFPQRNAFQPSLSFAWHPIAASSMLVRGGYGMAYDDPSYASIAQQMSQQSPLSKSISLQNSAAQPLTLANGFNASPASIPNTFGIDPHFRLGYVHTFQLSVQRDLPGGMNVNAQYTAIKGTHSLQAFQPNTFPSGGVNPFGYTYYSSGGNSIRHAGQIQLTRRLHNGLSASVTHVYAKAIDDAAALGGGNIGGSVAQDWLNLRGERGLSSFDQRQVTTAQIQYTTGVGMRGGALMGGWRGKAFKGWSITSQITKATGRPLTPACGGCLTGTGLSGTVRASATGLDPYAAPDGHFLNPLALTKPLPGQWGNAGRNSLTGPGQFSLNAAAQRGFQFTDKISSDVTLSAQNALNHVTINNWVSDISNSSQFGLPTGASGMRVVQLSMRVRF